MRDQLLRRRDAVDVERDDQPVAVLFVAHAEGIGVSVVHPGFVATPLTAQNTFHMPALISPEQAAKDMLQGWRDGLFDIHFPKRFTWFLKLLRILPYRWYFPLVRQFTA